MAMVNGRRRRLFARLNQLEQEYRLARQGLATGITFTKTIFLVALATMGGALYAFVVRGEGFLSGTQLVLIFLILVVAWISYFSFIFGRIVRLKTEINETEKQIEFSAGDSVRNKSEES